jgi:hypothetical protein
MERSGGNLMAGHAGRNELCPCGSGKKYKKCCALKERKTSGATVMMILVGVLISVGLIGCPRCQRLGHDAFSSR